MKSQIIAQNQQFIANLGESAVYMMGLSFLIGSLFTVFILVVFDYLRQRNTVAVGGKKKR